MHPPSKELGEEALVPVCLLLPPETAEERGQVAEDRDLLPVSLEVTVDLHRSLQKLRRSDALVEPSERQDPIAVRLESALRAELL